MPRHSEKRLASLAFVLLVVLIGSPIWQTYRQGRQDFLNRTLITALQHHDLPVALVALEAGADPNAYDDGQPSLSFGQRLRRLFDTLLGKSQARPAHPGPPALLLTVQSESDFNVPTTPLVQALIVRGADVNIQDTTSESPILTAIKWQNMEVMQALLRAGANVNAPDVGGHTPLLWAVGTMQIKFVRLLLARGADVTARDKDGDTALKLAQREGYTPIARLLKQAGAKE
jgi:hypothetical protein